MFHRHRKWRVPTSVLMLLLVTALMPLASHANAATVAASGCDVNSPSSGSSVTGPVTVSGTYTNAHRVQVAFDAGTIVDAHMVDPDGDDTGTWSYTLDPSSMRLSGEVEVTVRCSSVQDRYWRWGTTILKVEIPGQQAPALDIRSPKEGSRVFGPTLVTVAASDEQGLDSVQVRVDWGKWHRAIRAGRDRYRYLWFAPWLRDKTHSIEARAIDTDGNVTTTLTTYVKTGSGTSEPPAAQQSDRAMWVWEPATYQLLENPGARDVLGRFMDDGAVSQHGVTTLYLYADRYEGSYQLLEHPDQYRSLIAWAHSRGYKVHALLGSGSYMAPMLVYSRYHDKAIRLTDTVLNYNLASDPGERFDGINVDIEPYGLPDWRSRPTVQVQYLDMLAEIMARKEASGLNLNIGAAIPRWMDDSAECQDIKWHGTTKNCAQHIIDTIDYVSLMDYRDVATGAAGIIPQAQNEINYASHVGKKVMIGVETGQISASGDPETISFQEEGRSAMEAELAKVYKAFKRFPAFLGVAIHYYGSYRELRSAWSPGGTRWQSTVPDSANPTRPTKVTTDVFDWQRVDLHWRRSSDDTLVDHYEVYRSTVAGFDPNPETARRSTRSNSIKDTGLRPGTTYYWKVVAVDVIGKRSAASAPVSVTTPAGNGLAPMRIKSIRFSDVGPSSKATVEVVDAVTGDPIQGANVFGHWEGAAGRKFSVDTGSDGTATAATESLTAPYTVTFVPEKILAPGYYWASSLDTRQPTTWNRGDG